MNNTQRLDTRRLKNVTLADGSEYRIRSLFRYELGEIAKFKKQGEQVYNDVFVASCICDESGKQTVSCDDAVTGEFRCWDGGLYTQLHIACMEIVYPDRWAEPTVEQVEDALKNSKTTPGRTSAGGMPRVMESQGTTCISDSTVSTLHTSTP